MYLQLEGIPPTILTGNKAIDDHSMQSTLTGGMGDMVDKFRQQRLKEYFAITRLCKDNNVPLSEKLLERGKTQVFSFALKRENILYQFQSLKGCCLFRNPAW